MGPDFLVIGAGVAGLRAAIELSEAGTVLEVLEEKDRWCFVRQMDGYQGWAHRPYLTTPPAPAATRSTQR